ncbi:hypothetical protein BD779DRAFT_1670803 [Infundibulicybe gibba]|nr:hypothetical protein BD779DRAFT_1670803 [Infundibulicybe gibba]
MLLDPAMIPLLPENPRSPPPPPTRTFTISSAGGRGAGMFATVDIPAGALIHVEHPVFIAPAILHIPEAYEAMSRSLTSKTRADFLAMANCRRPDECCAEEGILRTNAIGLELAFPEEMKSKSEAAEYGGVFLNINRSNHSCGPNAAHKWDWASLSLSFYSLRPIRAGEEIMNVYTDFTAPRQTRRELLLQKYRFICDCPWCSLQDPSLIARSDRARAELPLELMEQEGMHGYMSLYLEEIAMCYAFLGDEKGFELWARRAMTLCAVPDPKQAADFARWLNNPKSFKNWAWRKKQRLHKPSRAPSPVYDLGLFL